MRFPANAAIPTITAHTATAAGKLSCHDLEFEGTERF
jgi:hypothetical protein